jgi:tripartite-type tricarboxylate transporter receptor subunit TctC
MSAAQCVLNVLSAVALMPSLSSVAADVSYPTRPVRVIVPLAPGGGTDNLSRIMAPRLIELLGQQVVVENRPGAGGQIGTDFVAKAAPDGYTILTVESSFASNPSLFRKLPYDTLKDFAPISLLAVTPNVLMVHPSVPARSLKELIALGKARRYQNRSRGGAVQERRARYRRRARRSGDDVVRWHEFRLGLCSGGPAACHCGHWRETQSVIA